MDKRILNIPQHKECESTCEPVFKKRTFLLNLTDCKVILPFSCKEEKLMPMSSMVMMMLTMHECTETVFPCKLQKAQMQPMHGKH